MSAPISIPIGIDDLGTPALLKLAGGMDSLAGAGTRLAKQFGLTERAGLSFRGELDAGTKALQAMADTSYAAVVNLSKVNDAFKLTADSAALMTKNVTGAGDAAAAMTLANQRMVGSIADVTTMIGLQATALQGLIDKQVLSSAIPPAGLASIIGGANTVGGGAVASVVAADAARLSNLGRASRILGSGIGATGGLAGRVGAAALGPEGLAALGAGYVGFKAAQDASQFWSALAQTGAQSGTTNPGGILADPTKFRQFGQGILNYGASGKDPYSVTTLATGVEPLLAHGYSAAAVQGAMKSIAQFSAQNKAPDISASVSLVNTLAALQGGAPGSQTAAQLAGYAGFGSRAEQLTTLRPGELNVALPRLLSSLSGTGVSAADATGMMIKMGTINPSASRDASAMIRLISDIASPTAAAKKEAAAIGVGIGPGAIDAYGGIYGYLAAVQGGLGTGPGAAQGAHRIFGQTNALQGYNALLAGGGLRQTAGYTTQLGLAGDNSQTAFDQLSKGTGQQTTQLMVRLNADMTTLGTTINDRVTPALIKMADDTLKAAENFFNLADPNSPKSQRSTGFWPSVGNWFDKAMAPLTGNTAPGTSPDHTWLNSLATTILGTNTVNTGTTVTTRADAAAIIANMYKQAGQKMPASVMEQLNASYDAQAMQRGAYGGIADQVAMHSNPNYFGAPRPPAYSVPGGVSAISRSEGYFYDAQIAAGTKPTRQSVMDDRSVLNTLTTMGATAAQMNASLAQLKIDLPGSAYSSAQQANIYAQEQKKVGIYNRGLNAPGDQTAINTAQQMFDAAKLMNDTPAQLKTMYDEYLAAERKLILDTTLPGSAAQMKLLGAVNQQGAVFTAGQKNDALKLKIQDLTDLQQAASLGGNKTLANQYGKQILGLDTANAGALGYDAAHLTLLRAQLANQMKIATPGPQLVRSPETGLGDALLGAGSGAATIARLSRSGGGQDPLAETVRHLQLIITRDEKIITELQRGNENTTAMREEIQAGAMVSSHPAANRGPVRRQMGH